MYSALFWMACVSTSRAEIVLSVVSGSSFFGNSGPQFVNINIRSSLASGEFISDLATNFAVQSPANFVNAFGVVSGSAGNFGGVSGAGGYFGGLDSGSLSVDGPGAASLSFLYTINEDPDGDPETIPQQYIKFVPNTDSLLLSLRIQTNGLAPGSYNITGNNGLARTSVTDFVANPSLTVLSATIFNHGSFSITAVPEPSSASLVVAVGIIGAWVRKRRRAKRLLSSCPAAASGLTCSISS